MLFAMFSDSGMSVHEAHTAPIRHVLFAGGGTGGHLYPSIAIAEQLRILQPGVPITFLCSDKPLDAEILTQGGWDFESMPARPMLLKPFPNGLMRFWSGWKKSTRATGAYLDGLMRDPDTSAHSIIVVLMGGYVAAPVARSAARRGIHVLMLNLDVVPGKANRLAARWASQIVSAVHCPSPPAFADAEVVGMPIRAHAIADMPRESCCEALGLDPSLRTFLITGASQGAGSLNDLIGAMVSDANTMKAFEGWQILHLCGPARQGDLAATYMKAGITARVIPFLDEMRLAWGAADLALSRAGASSVAEAAANQVPTIFAPYPWHADLHQKHNVEPILNLGGAWLVDDKIEVTQNLTTIGHLITRLLLDPDAIQAVRSALNSAKGDQPARAIAAIALQKKLN